MIYSLLNVLCWGNEHYSTSLDDTKVGRFDTSREKSLMQHSVAFRMQPMKGDSSQ